MAFQKNAFGGKWTKSQVIAKVIVIIFPAWMRHDGEIGLHKYSLMGFMFANLFLEPCEPDLTRRLTVNHPHYFI